MSMNLNGAESDREPDSHLKHDLHETLPFILVIYVANEVKPPKKCLRRTRDDNSEKKMLIEDFGGWSEKRL